MRYIIPESPPTKFINLGDTRIVIYFALLPVYLQREVRWLERVSIEQRYTQNFYSIDTGNPHYDFDYTKNEWNNIRFVNE